MSYSLYHILFHQNHPLADLIADTVSFAAVETVTLGAALLGVAQGEAEVSEIANRDEAVVEMSKELAEIVESKTEIKDTTREGRTEPQDMKDDGMDVSEHEILSVILTALNDAYDDVEVSYEMSKIDPNLKDTVISLSVISQGIPERVIINFTQRQVSYQYL